MTKNVGDNVQYFQPGEPPLAASVGEGPYAATVTGVGSGSHLNLRVIVPGDGHRDLDNVVNMTDSAVGMAYWQDALSEGLLVGS